MAVTNNVRVTFYVVSGTTASGVQTHLGVAACSYQWEFGTRFRFSDGREVICYDRGPGLSSSQIDVWVPSMSYGYEQIEGVYGYNTTVERLN